MNTASRNAESRNAGSPDVVSRPAPVPGARFPLADRQTWLSTIHVLTDMWVGLIGFIAMVTLLSTTFSLAITFVLAIPFAWLTIFLARHLARMERARARVFLGVDVADPHQPIDGGWWTRLRKNAISGVVWREIAYLVVLLPVGIVGWALTLATWSGGLFLVALPLTVRLMPDDTADLGPIELSGWLVVLASAVGVGIVGWLAPWTSRAWARIDAALVRSLLGPNVSKQLEARVETLTVTRALAVDAAEEERRRIERDLHDGAQQRLVALAIELGMARSKMDTDPEEARALIEGAHESAKEAIAELRSLARGIHPVALTDRGLPGAIPGLAARSPLPVDVTVDVPERPVPAIEGIAYFVVSEALTNIAKHSGADRGRITIVRADDRLRVEVLDNGHGGATMTAGSGLRGLADRVAAVDGRFTVDSPPGGPTAIRVDLPCVLEGSVTS